MLFNAAFKGIYRGGIFHKNSKVYIMFFIGREINYIFFLNLNYLRFIDIACDPASYIALQETYMLLKHYN